MVVDEEQRLESCSLTARFGRIVLGKFSLIAVATPASSAAPAATISAIAAPAPGPRAATAFGLGPRLIDVDGASAHGGAIQSCDRLIAVLVAGHLHETETTGAPRVTVCHDAHAVHLSERLKDLPEFVFVCVETQISNENILHASASALGCRKCKQFGGLGRAGEPFLKIETAAGEQSNAPSSIAGFPKPACENDFEISSLEGLRTSSALVHLPISLSMESHL
jgi:hypothetical protein